MKVGILFGGRSYEHDISIITAAQVAAALDGRVEIYPIYAKDGDFFYLKGGIKLEQFAKRRIQKRKACFAVKRGKGALCFSGRKIVLDCMLMCCHGGEGEDGRFSALMEVFGFPYTAPNILPSALTMDKRMTKRLCLSQLIPTAEGVVGRIGDDVFEKAKSLGYPLIVKPARLGSSIGISVAHDEKELSTAMECASSFDRDLVIEEMIKDAVELNCAAFREGKEIVVSAVENPRSWNEFLTFGEKYEGGKYKSGSNRIIKGTLSERVRAMTRRVYEAFELDGIVRVDYLYSEREDLLFLNEINAQPGSLAYYLFEEVGIEFSDLLMRVIEEAIRRAEHKDIISFNSGVLDNLSALSQK